MLTFDKMYNDVQPILCAHKIFYNCVVAVRIVITIVITNHNSAALIYKSQTFRFLVRRSPKPWALFH